MFFLHGFGVGFLLVGIAIYFLPAVIGRNKRNAGAIFVLNLLLGWTLLGWIAALVWALTTDSPPAQPMERPVVSVRYCHHCGKPCNAGAQYCDGCGTPAGSVRPR